MLKLLLIAVRLPPETYFYPPTLPQKKVYRVYLLKPIDGIQSRDASGKFGFIDNPHLF